MNYQTGVSQVLLANKGAKRRNEHPQLDKAKAKVLLYTKSI